MPPRRRAPRRKPARKGRKGARKSRVPRTIAPKMQMASIVESYEIENIVSNNLQRFNFSLNQFERAQKLSTLFKWYKAAHVSYSLEPMFNVYQAGGTGTSAIPYVYTRMNRTGDQTQLNINDLLAMGCRPKKLTTLKKIAYKPNWCSPGLISYQVAQASGFGGVVTTITQNGLKPEYGWLASPTDVQLVGNTTGNNFIPSVNFNGATNLGNTLAKVATASPVYNGHHMIIEQLNGSALTMCKVTCTVHWVFKDPKYTLANSNSDVFAYDVSGNLVPSEVVVHE
ncbi:Cap [Chicken proventriculitis-associated circular virus 24]|nr:Cap [Chicken proventriculitis-associated circular virus 24]